MLAKALAGAAAAASTAWNISAATYNGSPINFFSVTAQDTNLAGMFFKPDGTKMYVIGRANDNVYEYDLSSAWDINTASYLQSFSIATEDLTSSGIFFKSDGTKMYMVGYTTDSVYEYNLSSAWDISSAVYSQSFSVAAEETFPQGISFKDDGTKMYVIGQTGDDVNEYNLSSAWDISSAVYSQNFSVTGGVPTDVFFKGDGTKMYVTNSTSDIVEEYSLSSAWDVSTATYVQNFSVASQDTSPAGLFFKDDGTKMYIVGGTTDSIYQYDLSSAWDISTASFSSPTTDYFYVGAQDISPYALFFKGDGTKMYFVGSTGDSVYEYDLSSAWDISSSSYLQSFSVASEEQLPAGLFFKDDGTKMYIAGSNGDEVNEYDLSSAWDVSTASYVQNFSVASQDTNPAGLFFKDDGTKMYIVGNSGDSVYQYDLSSAWNISTASYVQSFSVASQDTGPIGVFFKDDGTKMYISGNGGIAVYQYGLSSAWDISTASYAQIFSVAAQEASPSGVFFKDDGTKMYISGNGADAIWSYDL